MAPPLLTHFSPTRPRFEIAQDRLLAWLTEAHSEAEAVEAHLDGAAKAAFAERLAKVMRRCACAPDKIGRRGVSVDSVAHADWTEEDPVYDVAHHPHGRGTRARSRLFAELVNAYFDAEYSAETLPPRDLIHVTCTGYVSPSGAQRLVARRGWGALTRVIHAYHMGCYAALPALRIAAGLLATQGPRGLGPARADGRVAPRVDVVHTELCSLHLDPAAHGIEQLVVQTLFADGLIRYSVESDDGHTPGLRLLASHECILPESDQLMTWTAADHGMQMSLAREVPETIAGALRGFVLELYRHAGLDPARTASSVFAVHPGGPKIIDRVREVLELDDRQVSTSREVLHDHGNMSSATLPHVWMRVLADARVLPGTLVPSLAFGPGLTVCGGLFEKR